MKFLQGLFWFAALAVGLYLGIYAFIDETWFKLLLAGILVAVSYNRLAALTIPT